MWVRVINKDMLMKCLSKPPTRLKLYNNSKRALGITTIPNEQQREMAIYIGPS